MDRWWTQAVTIIVEKMQNSKVGNHTVNEHIQKQNLTREADEKLN